MAERIELFPELTVAGTAIATPITTPLTMNPGVVERIEVTVPPGPSGLVGFRILHSGQIVIPFKGSNYFILDDAQLSWPIQGFPTGDKWTVQTYNTDSYDHTVYIRMHVNEIPAPPLPTLSIVPIP